MKTLKEHWLALSIASKMRLFVLFLLLGIVMTSVFNLYSTRFSVGEVNQILKEISQCETAQDAMTAEEAAFKAYVHTPSAENYSHLEQSVLRTRSSISLLPDDYSRIGAERSAWTWRVRNGYRSYAENRDLLSRRLQKYNSPFSAADALEKDERSVRLLYQIYDMQTYLKGYMQSLSQLTVAHASDVYDMKYPILQSMPYLQLLLSSVLLLIAVSFSGVFVRSIVDPIQALAAASRSISRGNLEEADVTVRNKDELGELVDAFAQMKRATRDNIKTLQENQRLSEQLHKEAMERAEMEKRLEAARMDLLQSQIKPHFLFNTLNTISGMAELEGAETTDHMIRSLSRLFRYNLHTSDQFVSLSQELDVAEDYLYLQKMRFGDRIQYELIPERRALGEDLVHTTVPVFLLQPLIENAVIHGISKMEQGGRIVVRIFREDSILRIRIEDTGKGMSESALQDIQDKLNGLPSDAHIGIGLGNLFQRLNSLYSAQLQERSPGESVMKIRSAPGKGTTIALSIPLPLSVQDSFGAGRP